MKTALILHGTSGSSEHNWFAWLKKRLEQSGYQVWCPDLPEPDHPNILRYNQFILSQSTFRFDEESILIGHSSGAVAILGLLQELPEHLQVQASYLIGSFRDDLGQAALSGLFIRPFEFSRIKNRSRLWYFLHSDDDPYCPLDHARFLHQQIGGDLIVLAGQKHFSVGTAGERYREFPYLHHLITGDALTTTDVTRFYLAMKRIGVQLWLDGGWGVDALLEKQTRNHGDIDIVIQKKDVDKCVEYLKKLCYEPIERSDSTDFNFMLGNGDAQFVDLHVIEFDEHSNGVYGSKQNGKVYPAESLRGKGSINGVQVQCISPEWVLQFRAGYELRQKDRDDITAICNKFGLHYSL